MSQVAPHHLTTEQKQQSRIDPRIFLLTLGTFALGTDAFVVAGVLPMIAKETGVTEGLAGQLVTVFSLTYGLGAPLLAAIIGRWPRNRVLIAALGLFGLANLGSALAPSYLLLLISRILVGCFAAVYTPLAYTTATALAPAEKRGQALSLVVVGITVATAIGSPLGTWVGEHYGWRFSFVLITVLAGIAFLALLLCGLPKERVQSVLPLKARLAPIAHPVVALALLPALFWNLGAFLVYTYIAPLLQQNLHILDISGLLVAYGLGAVGGTLSGGRLADRFGAQRPIITLLIVLSIVEAILVFTTTSLLSTLVTLFIFGLLTSLIFIPQQHRLLSVAPEHANVILALNNSTFYLGIAAGAAIGGVALRTVAVTQLGWLGAAFMLLALLAFFLSIYYTRTARARGLSKSVDQEQASQEKEEVFILPE
ncbi:MFS transporter [Ktedonosporobacter rubrisoli]|uniref:MFS transporter n=1 Tax=Ktedonosporobacter rubrisoli TaxID=2509675 RepID=A0A4P6JWM1_KTERU|nr:MFS transporter [Ktedonosporobacter rubrisoli]QBD79780.1 MFS transporter [Ktedonosporobacter rubrisoli]